MRRACFAQPQGVLFGMVLMLCLWAVSACSSSGSFLKAEGELGAGDHPEEASRGDDELDSSSGLSAVSDEPPPSALEEAQQEHSSASDSAAEDSESAGLEADADAVDIGKDTYNELSEEERALVKRKLSEIEKLSASDQGAQAMAQLQELLGKWPQLALLHYNLGVLHEHAQESDLASAAYRRALTLLPDFEEALENLLRIHLRKDQAELALEELEMLRERIGDSPLFRESRIELLALIGKKEQAEEEAKAILQLDERNVPAMLHLARMWHEEAKFELVRQVLENARDIEPQNPQVLNRLGLVLLELGHRNRALETFRRAAGLSGASAAVYSNLGVLLVEVSDCAGAVSALETASELAADDPAIRLNLGNAYSCMRRFEQAQEQYELALLLDPELDDARFNLAVLFLDGEFENMDRAQRLRTSLEHFAAYQQAGGDDSRWERYRDEAAKALEREEARLARAQERERQAQERAEREAARRREEEARLLAEKMARQQEIDAGKVARKSALEEDPMPEISEENRQIGKIRAGK